MGGKVCSLHWVPSKLPFILLIWSLLYVCSTAKWKHVKCTLTLVLPDCLTFCLWKCLACRSCLYMLYILIVETILDKFPFKGLVHLSFSRQFWFYVSKVWDVCLGGLICGLHWKKTFLKLNATGFCPLEFPSSIVLGVAVTNTMFQLQANLIF